MSPNSFTPNSLQDLAGKVCVITGGNAGIGYQTVYFLASKRATVYMGCRSREKGLAAITSIQKIFPDADIRPLIIDHMDLCSVATAGKELAGKEPKIHVLINNAGIMAVPFAKSQDGFESQLQTNYISHWLFTYHLIPTLLATSKVSRPGDVRIVNVSSMGHNFAPKSGISFEDINQEKGGIWSRYGQSKLGNVLHAKSLNSFYGPNGSKKEQGEIWTAGIHPGNVYTDLNRNATFLGPLSSIFAKFLNTMGAYIPAEHGAYTSLFCAVSDSFKAENSGGYFVPLGKLKDPSKYAQDGHLAAQLWNWTEKDLRSKGLIE